MLLYVLPKGVIGGGLVLTGIGLFLTGQAADRSRGRWRVWGLTVAALLVFVLANVWTYAGWWDMGVAAAGASPGGRPAAGRRRWKRSPLPGARSAT